MSEVIVYDKAWNEIQRQDWPDIPGTVFITIDPNATANGQRWRVSMWVKNTPENMHDQVLGLGSFWQQEDAILFANAKADEIAISMLPKDPRAEELLRKLRGES